LDAINALIPHKFRDVRMSQTASKSIVEHGPRPAPSTLKAYMFKILRDAIVAGRYAPGSRLNESQLAREYGISRIPIREALMQLEESGLVMNHQRRGMFVTELSEEDVQKINSLRVVLEAEALRLARTNMTDEVAQRLRTLVLKMNNWGSGHEIDAAAIDLEFHRTIWRAAGNAYLAKTLESVSTVLFAHTALQNELNTDSVWQLDHHRELLDVALGLSNESAESAIIKHLKMHYKYPERFSSFRA
jgi:DNA-binding GntR family transcriptional regulator